MKTVILAEKPSQAKAYVECFAQHTKHTGYYQVNDPLLPQDTIVTYGFGHLVELVTPDKYDVKYQRWALAYLPIFPTKFKYHVPYKKQAQFKIVKKWLLQAETIIIATDADREGENIAWSIMRQAGVNLKQVTLKRLWINSLERQVVRAGFKNLHAGMDFYPKYQEAMTREISDWLVGMNASPLYTLMLKKYGISGTFSVGRVQTPTLAIVYQRQQEISKFIAQPYQEIAGEVLDAGTQTFHVQLDPKQQFFDSATINAFLTKHNVELGVQSGTVIASDNTTITVASPRLFSLSTLQAQVNRMYHASASATLVAVQNLYEAKLLTYPRTDTNFITLAEFDYLKSELLTYETWLDIKLANTNLLPQKRYVNEDKVQEHHAIIPTRNVPTPRKWAQLSELERKIYRLVLATTMAMFAETSLYHETTLQFKVGRAVFKAQGKQLVRPGWQLLFPEKLAHAEQSASVPQLAIGKKVAIKVSLIDKITQPPAALTEGTLIMAMKHAGKFVDDADDQAILKATEGIGTEATRAGIIEKLKQKKYLTVKGNTLTVSESGQVLCEIVATQPLLVSPKMTAQWEIALNQIGSGTRTSTNFIAQIERFLTQVINQTPTIISNDLALQEKLTHYQSKVAQPTVLGACPWCQTGAITERKQGYRCTNTSCHYQLPKVLSRKTLPKTALKQLVKTGKSTLIKGFKSKNNRPFSAQLAMIDQKLTFIFPEK